MYCKTCGCENPDGSTKCSVCGNYFNNNNGVKSLTVNKDTKLPEKTQNKILTAVSIVLILALVIPIVYGLFQDDFESFFDEARIVGSWEMDTSQFQSDDWIDTIGNLNGVITKITFMSDGTCIVDGTSSHENGTWSMIDDQLKVVGTAGGMFWNYNGFICDYDLDGDTLRIYDENQEYYYYRQ